MHEPVKRGGFTSASVNCLCVYLHARISGCPRDPLQPWGFLAYVPLLLTAGVSGTFPAVDLVLSSPVAKTTLLMGASEPGHVQGLDSCLALELISIPASFISTMSFRKRQQAPDQLGKWSFSSGNVTVSLVFFKYTSPELLFWVSMLQTGDLFRW